MTERELAVELILHLQRANQAGVQAVRPGLPCGRGGVRVEDDVVITEQAGRSLSAAPREVRRVG
jgi:hypothetical protein